MLAGPIGCVVKLTRRCAASKVTAPRELDASFYEAHFGPRNVPHRVHSRGHPYLDRGLAEITGKLPVGLKLKGFQKRYIFKRAFAKLLPEEILRKKKHGFGLPIAHWLRTHAGFRETAHSLLLDTSAMQRGYFNRSALEKLLRQHDEEKSDFYGTFIWNIMMLELWHRNHKDKLQTKCQTIAESSYLM